MSRRGNNEGSVYKRKDGRWCAAVTTGYSPETGKPVRAYFYADTRTEVVAKRDAALVTVKAGTYVKPTRQTVGEWLDIWLETYVAPSVRPKTWASYESIIRVHLQTTLGSTDLRALQTNHIQRMLNDKFASGLSARTIEFILFVLKASLKQAQREGLVPRNAAEHIRKPKKEPKAIRVLTMDEMNTLIQLARKDRMGPIYITMLGTGLRVGELIGLEWANVNLRESTLSVVQSVVYTSSPGRAGRGDVIQNPKTDSGRRRIPLPDHVVSTLRQWRRTQAQEKLLMGAAYFDSPRVFTNADGATLKQRHIARKLSTMAAKAGIEHVNPHALRHTYATRLLEANVHPKVVQELLGHTDITLTLNTYSHVMPEIKQAAAKALDAILNPSMGSPKTQF